jgi:galactokinase
MEDQQIKVIIENFRSRFAGEPRLFRAPGRVNLIGEHTDYNDGFVLPFAIDRATVAAGVVRNDSLINVSALDVDEAATIDLGEPGVKRRGTWLDYVEGSARCARERIGFDRGADIVFSSTVPIGSGLSSSAALEVSIGYALLSLNGEKIDRKELAFASQQAEHEFVGIRSGIMDQFTSAFGKRGNALLLDCRSLEIKYIPLELGEAVVAVCDTKVKHKLASSEYNTRREECETGVGMLKQHLPGIKALRDVSVEDFEKFGDTLPEPVRSRCRHVVTENERTLAAADSLQNSDLKTAGQLMFLSHRSLRDDYDVSCPELDRLVDSAAKIGGVYGARMTGGGFGGCTVNLLARDSFDEFSEKLSRDYAEAFGFEPEIFRFQAADGASEIAP